MKYGFIGIVMINIIHKMLELVKKQPELPLRYYFRMFF